MPYKVTKSGSSYTVRKKSGGKKIGTHRTKSGAKRQIRAIYANKSKRK